MNISRDALRERLTSVFIILFEKNHCQIHFETILHYNLKVRKSRHTIEHTSQNKNNNTFYLNII